MASYDSKDSAILADYIAEKFVETISGSGKDDYLVGELPEDRIMVGMLAANRVIKNIANGELEENRSTKYKSVPSIGLTFFIKKGATGKINIAPMGYFFYRVQPVYPKLIEHLLRSYSLEHGRAIKDLDDLTDLLKAEGKTTVEIPSTYKRVAVGKALGKFSLSIEEILKKGNFDLNDQLQPRMQELVDKIQTESVVRSASMISIEHLLDEKAFKEVTHVDTENKIAPQWNLHIKVETKEIEDKIRVTIRLVNLTVEPPRLRNLSYCPHLFNAHLEVQGEGFQFEDIKLDFFKEDYRKKPIVKATAENATIEFDTRRNLVRTINVPIYHQKRLVSDVKFEKNLAFSALISDSIGNLEFIAKSMEQDLARIKDDFEASRTSRQYSAKGIEAYLADIRHYEQEINRFQAGIKIIKHRDLAKRAFRLMNETFAIKLYESQKTYNGWYLFQLVFIVSLINDIVKSEYPTDALTDLGDLDIVDILYYPTGGGKTEAFLGAAAFAAFFDRLRGKNDGVTAIIKYPLRLVSIQQLERALDVIAKAETIRQKHAKELQGSEFSVGFLVGQSNSPNEITETRIFDQAQEEIDEECRLIEVCPFCGEESVHVSFDEESWRLIHRCGNENCGKTLPVYVVDNEIYRFLPTVLVSTIDKWASVGFQSKIKTILGYTSYKCPKHGYSCTEYCSLPFSINCSEELEEVDARKDPVPTLNIQDELHLVRESLGTFDSHYETFVQLFTQELLPEDIRKKMKYIGATATITNYQDHVWNLYHKRSICFPTRSPDPNRNFYSYVDEENCSRIILGYSPYGRSVIDGMWQSNAYLKEILYTLITDKDNVHKEMKKRGFNGSSEDLAGLLDKYWIYINYHNAKQDAYDLDLALRNQGNNFLNMKRIPEFDSVLITGDESFQSIRSILADMENRDDLKKGSNVILATSSISHGVDEIFFNNILFYGMPNNTAEYVQAYSRVGRRYTGIVLDVMRLVRERDRSYLRNFVLFHENKDELIEPVPINRWAKNAIHFTLPGLLSGLFLQYYPIKSGESRSLYKAINLKRAVSDGEITIEEVTDLLKRAYGCDPGEKVSLMYSDVIEEEVKRFFRELENASITRNTPTDDIIQSAFSHHIRPMRSLRDTDELLEINRGRWG